MRVAIKEAMIFIKNKPRESVEPFDWVFRLNEKNIILVLNIALEEAFFHF